MAHSSSTEKLLSVRGSSSEISDDDIDSTFLSNRRRSRIHSVLKHSIIHFALLSVYTAIFFSFWPDVKNHNRQEPGDVYSMCCPKIFCPYVLWQLLTLAAPAKEAIKWELRTFENSLETANPYKGEPRKELDEAWNKLLDPSAIRVSKDDLNKINRTSVPILDGSGYMATLGLSLANFAFCNSYS
jgi:hypothetical protein